MDVTTLEMFENTINELDEFIFIKPICDFFKINYENQCRIIQKDTILKTSSTKKSNKMLFGDERERYTLSKKGFIRWIQLLNPQLVQVSLRDKLEIYQSNVFEFFYQSAIERKQFFEIYSEILSMQRAQKELNSKIKERKEVLHSFKFIKEMRFSLPMDLFSQIE
jgi:hypothetical protein